MNKPTSVNRVGDALYRIADANNAHGESFTRERLQTMLLGDDKSAGVFLARIEANQFDDITMLAVRWR